MESKARRAVRELPDRRVRMATMAYKEVRVLLVRRVFRVSKDLLV
jgi:hypothetical protein